MNLLRLSCQLSSRHHMRMIRSRRRADLYLHQISGGRRRRNFSDFSSQRPSRLPASQEKDFERFTSYALNSRVVPLGSISDDLWEETVDVINGWFQVGGGFGLDSAARLLRRLDAEYAVLNPLNGSFKQKASTLMKLHRLLLQSWLELHTNHGHSQLALLKADDALQRLIVSQHGGSISLPIDEILFVIERWLNVQTSEGLENATRLLLLATDHTTDFEADISPYLEATRTRFLDLQDKSASNKSELYDALLARMKMLRDSENWKSIKLKDASVQTRITEGATDTDELKKVEETGPSELDPHVLIERAVKAIRNAGEADQRAVETLVTKLYGADDTPDTEIIVCLVDFYSRAKDSEKAMYWIQKLDRSMFSEKINARPNVASFKFLLEAMETEQIQSKIENMIHFMMEHWTTFSNVEKQELAEQTIKLTVLQGNFMRSVYKVLDRLKEEDIRLSESAYKMALQGIHTETANPKFVMHFMKVFEAFEDDISFPLYQSVIQTLLKFEKKALNETGVVFSHVLDKVQNDSNAVSTEGFGEFLYSVLAMYTYRNLYNQAEDSLRRAEKALLTKTPNKGELSPIPVECYQRMIKRKWYTKTTAPWAEQTFRRLMQYFECGYSNLLPNQDIFASVIRAVATTRSDASQVEEVLNEMLNLYEASGDDSCKPNADIFNAVLLAYKQDSQKTRVAGSKSLSLFETMQHLNIQPDTKSLNFVIQNVMRSTKKEVYPQVNELFRQFDLHNLEPDKFSRHFMLDACASASPKNRDNAIKTALETFGDIRQGKEVGPVTYNILTKVLLRLLSKDSRADKVGTSAFQLCCEDGYFEQGEVKKRFQSLMSREAWDGIYTIKLQDGRHEPSAWSRNSKKNASQ